MMRIRWNQYVRNERGSGMTILVIGLLMATIFLTFIFFDFSNVFINKRVTQTGADAAALAAAKSSRISMKEELKKETEKELDELGKRWEAFLSSSEEKEKDKEKEKEKEKEKGKPKDEKDEPAPTTDELLEKFVESEESSHGGRTIPGDMKSWLLDHSTEVEANSAMKFFFDDEGVSKIACKAVRDNFDSAKKEADKFAEENNNDRVKTLTFIADEFRVFASTERKGDYTTVSSDAVPAISSESSARIGEPKGFRISCD